MNYRDVSSICIGVLCVIVLSACGGGGGDSTPPPTTATPPVNSLPPTTASFPLAASFKALIDAGSSDSFEISGSCAGTATVTLLPSVPTTFEGAAVVASPQDSTATLNNCPAFSSGSASGSTYYTPGSYATIGLSVSGGEYAVAQTTPAALPTTPKIGDSGSIVTLDTYKDSSKLQRTGTRVLKWTIEADGTSTTSSIFNLITENYNTSNLLLSTQQSRYRLAQSGALVINTVEVQFSGTSVLRLLYTKR